METTMGSPKHDPGLVHQPLTFASLRPTTIFEAEDPTLDPFAVTHAQPPSDRLLPGTLSLVVYGVLAIGCVYLATHGVESFRASLIGPERSMNVLLEPETLGKHVPKVQEGPSGGGRGGLGNLDSGYMLARMDTPTPKAANPDLDDFLLLANPSVPLAPGGDGLSKGKGPGSGGGTGGGTGAGSGIVNRPEKSFDFQLIAIKKVDLFYQLSSGQTQSPCVVAVAILIEADGRVSHAQAVSGPAYLHVAAEAAARQWMFEPLLAHGLQAPYRIKINFHYKG